MNISIWKRLTSWVRIWCLFFHVTNHFRSGRHFVFRRCRPTCGARSRCGQNRPKILYYQTYNDIICSFRFRDLVEKTCRYRTPWPGDVFLWQTWTRLSYLQAVNALVFTTTKAEMSHILGSVGVLIVGFVGISVSDYSYCYWVGTKKPSNIRLDSF